MKDIVDSAAYSECKLNRMSSQTTLALKGVFAIAVLVHHIYQRSGLFRATMIGTMLQLLGALSVSVFFFLSGYGVMVSYLQSPKRYMQGFLENEYFRFIVNIQGGFVFILWYRCVLEAYRKSR